MQQDFTERGHMRTSMNCHCALRSHYSFCPLVSAHCTHLFPSSRKKHLSGPFLFLKDKTDRKFHSARQVSIVSSSTFWFHFTFILSLCTPSSFSLMCPTEATNVLIIISVLARRAGVDESLQTHPCIHTCARSPCTHWTLMCGRPANSDLNQKYIR